MTGSPEGGGSLGGLGGGLSPWRWGGGTQTPGSRGGGGRGSPDAWVPSLSLCSPLVCLFPPQEDSEDSDSDGEEETPQPPPPRPPLNFTRYQPWIPGSFFGGWGHPYAWVPFFWGRGGHSQTPGSL